MGASRLGAGFPVNCTVCNKFARTIEHFFTVGNLPTGNGYTVIAPPYYRMVEGEVVPYCGPVCATTDITTNA
jgi:hypothetical protein